MKLIDALYRSQAPAFEVFGEGLDEPISILEAEVRELECVTLYGSLLSSGQMDGRVVVRAEFDVTLKGLNYGYLEVILPERIVERHFIFDDGQIRIGEGQERDGRKLIPVIGFETQGNYGLFYSKKRASLGIGVLRNGLLHSKNPAILSLDLAYILRDENWYEEAIECFDRVIAESEASYLVYAERAVLLERLGRTVEAEGDWARVRQIAGEDGLRALRT